MTIQQTSHPTKVHLAALALGRLKAESAAKIQSHVSQCETCSRYMVDTPRGELVEVVREAGSRSAAERNTHITGNSGTVVGEPPATELFVPSDRARQASSASGIPADLQSQTKYRIIRLLGRGGMGSVYEAEHLRMNRKVAIKTINPELVDHPQALLRFEAEVKAVAALDHANIARAYDAESFGALQAIVMEFVPGQTLYDFHKSRSRLSVTDACRCVRQALNGLQHAHDQGLVHRDLKPQNLMVTRGAGIIKILDFGLAKAVSENRQSRGLTSANVTMGTYAYMAPEQALDAAKADIRADIYSLGCTLYYLIAGVLPFHYDTDTELLLAHQNESPQPLNAIRLDVPLGLSDLVARMLAKDSADRPQTPREAADALLPFAKGEGVASSPKMQATAARFNGWMWGGTAAAVLAFLWFVAWATGMFTVRTAHGTIVVENVPADAHVAVDGQIVTVSRNGDSVTISAVEEGPHHLKLLQHGRELWSDDVTIVMAGQMVSLRFEPVLPPSPVDKLASPEVAEKGPPLLSNDELRPPQPLVDKQSEDETAIPSGNVAFPNADIRAGEWSIENGELVQSAVRRSDQQLFFGDPDWSDYDFSFKAKAVEGTHGFKGLFRASAAGCCLFACGNYGNSTTDLSYGLPEGLQRGKYAGLMVEFNRWYSIRIEARDSTFKCYVGDELLIADTRIGLSSGRVGLATWDSAAHFKDFEVRTPEGKLLWHGLPRLPSTQEKTLAPPMSGEVANPADEQAVGEQSLGGGSDMKPAPKRVIRGPAVPRAVRSMEGIWRIEGDELVCEGVGDSRSIIFGDPNWTDFDLTYQCCRSNHVAAMKSQFRSDGQGNRVVFSMGGYGGSNNWCEIYCGKKDEPWSRANRNGRGIELAENTWFQVHVYCRGSDFYASVDGKKIAHMERDDFPKGFIGFSASKDGVVRFKDVKVTAPDGTILWEGFPDLHLGKTGSVSAGRAPSTESGGGPNLTSNDGFEPLFNGRNLRGWKTHSSQRGGWEVNEEGHLVGSGRLAHLYTRRGNYENVRVRAKVRINDGGNSGIIVRAPFGPQRGNWLGGYEAQINATHRDPNRTGSIYGGEVFRPILQSPVRPGEWFTEEIMVQDNHLTVLVNGQQVAEYIDDARLYDRGHIALQCTGEETRVEFASVEVMELLPTETAKTARPTPPPKRIDDLLSVGSVWKGQRINGDDGYSAMYTLYVTGRDGRRFSGHVFVNGPNRNRALVEGEVNGTSLTWRERMQSINESELQGTLISGKRVIQGVFSTKWTNGAAKVGSISLALESADPAR